MLWVSERTRSNRLRKARCGPGRLFYNGRPHVPERSPNAMSTITEEARVVDAVRKQLFVGGEWRDATGGATLTVEDPATGEAIAEVADGTPDDAMAALDAAVEVQPSWAQTAPRERGEILRRAFELLTERSDELALVMTLEMGKPLAESKGEITYAAEFLRWFSEEAVRIDGRYAVAPNGQGRLLTMR